MGGVRVRGTLLKTERIVWKMISSDGTSLRARLATSSALGADLGSAYLGWVGGWSAGMEWVGVVGGCSGGVECGGGVGVCGVCV